MSEIIRFLAAIDDQLRSLHISYDTLTALLCFFIFLTLLFSLDKTRALPGKRVLYLFCGFLFTAGITYTMIALRLWTIPRGLETVFAATTALISLVALFLGISYFRNAPRVIHQQEKEESEKALEALRESERALSKRAEQSALLAELGQRALAGTEPQELMDIAVESTSRALDVPVCDLLQFFPDEHLLVSRSWTGWKQERDYCLKIPATEGSLGGYILQRADPLLVVPSLFTETRFKAPAHLMQEGIVSCAFCLIPEQDHPFGLLGIYSTGLRDFSSTTLEFLQTIANIMAIAIQRKTAEETANQFACIVESSDDAITSTTPDGSISSWNPGSERLYGYTEKEVMGRPISILMPPDRSRELNEILEKVRNGHSIIQLDTERLRKDGTRVEVSLTVSPILNHNRQVTGASMIARDVTEKRNARERIARSEKQLRIAQRIARVGSWEWDARHDTFLKSDEFSQLLGLKPGEPKGGYQEYINLIHPDDRDFVKKEIEKALVKHRAFEFEHRVVRPDGKHAIFNTQGEVMADETGHPVRIIGVSQDITLRKKAEQTFYQTERRYQQLVESMNAIVWRADPQSYHFGYVSQEAEQVLGYPADEWISDSSFWKNHIDPEDRDWVLAYSAKATAEKRNHDFEYRMRARDGRIVWFRNLVSVIQENQQAKTLIGVMIDITEQKKMEQQLHKSREQLRSLTRYLQSVREEERTRVAREVHDELGQVMTALKMDLSLLNQKMMESSAVIPRKALFDEFQSMTKLVDTAIASVRRIITELRPEVLDHLGLKAAIEWQAQEFQTRTGILCEVRCRPESMELQDHDRATALFRIFQEALTNVSRHANATKVFVSLEEKNDSLVLNVIDNGNGAREVDLTKAGAFGLLGMKERAALLGGEVRISCRPEEGLSVHVEIPLKAVQAH